MTDIRIRHTRGFRRCACGQRHSRQQWLYLRDQHARVVHPGGEAGARAAGWKQYQTKPLTVHISSERIEQLQRICRIHGQSRSDPRACLAPACGDRYPCYYRQTAEAELTGAGIAVWTPR